MIFSHARLTLEKVRADSSASSRDERIKGAMDAEARRPIEFTRAPLVRAALLELAPNDHVLMSRSTTSSATAGPTASLSANWPRSTMRSGMNCRWRFPPLALQYARLRALAGGVAQDARVPPAARLLARQLAGEIPALDFPTDFPRQSAPTSGAVLVTRLLPAALTEALRRVCQEEGVTLFMIFLAAYGALLHLYTSQSRVLVGTTAANRNRPELERSSVSSPISW